MGEEVKVRKPNPVLDSSLSRIIFLGTGSGNFVRGKQIRATGGIILQIQGNQFHIDPGPGALLMARDNKVSLRENTAVLVSHSHIGHANDLNAVIDAMTYMGFDRQGLLISNYKVINGSEDSCPVLNKFYKDCLEKCIVLKEGQKVGVNDVEILAIPAKHTEAGTLGFRFLTKDFNLTYSSDTSYSNELLDFYKNSDILILNVVNPLNNKSEGNLNTFDAIKIMKKINPKLAVITHFGIKMIEADPLYEAREIQKEVDCQVIAAKDGMVISPSSYSAKSEQKSLKFF